MERFFETLSPSVGMTLIICVTILILAVLFAFFVSVWRYCRYKAEKESENREKEVRDKPREEKEKTSAGRTDTVFDADAEALKREVERKKRVLSLTEKLCELTEGTLGETNLGEVKALFELYKEIDKYDKNGE